MLHPEFHSDKLEDRSAGVISIELTHPDCKKLSMSFRPIPEFTTEPRLFLVMKAEPQKPTVRKIDVLNNYDEDFEVESITSKIGSQPKILNQQKITGGYRFEIEITPPAPDEKGRYDDTLNVNIKGGKKLEINTFIRYSIQSDSAQLQTKLDN